MHVDAASRSSFKLSKKKIQICWPNFWLIAVAHITYDRNTPFKNGKGNGGFGLRAADF